MGCERANSDGLRIGANCDLPTQIFVDRRKKHELLRRAGLTARITVNRGVVTLSYGCQESAQQSASQKYQQLMYRWTHVISEVFRFLFPYPCSCFDPKCGLFTCPISQQRIPSPLAEFPGSVLQETYHPRSSEIE